eukprot:TRINITY_DN66953_c8_g2_i5.p1 TRINITY_DN66953_c8_g2~~TRINITY_DN66953_c8_g2_i5.p1  ORF type:complete len:186 (-),score=93.43 TRINITY_DN66953_c8_g2_i5:197-721(-)
MPTYHSSFTEAKADVCGTAVLPLRTTVKGPAPPSPDGQVDVIDEAIKFHRANVLFRNYKPQSPADLQIAYLCVYIGELIRFCVKYKTKNEAKKAITQISMSGSFAVPGEGGFCLTGFFSEAASRHEADTFRAYFRQLREETAIRLIDRIYDENGEKNKWWFQFSKKKFMNIARA